MRTHQEITDKLDELAYFEFCTAQIGESNLSGSSELKMLNWLLRTDYRDLYPRGKQLYETGIRYRWDTTNRKYIKVIKIDVPT